MRHGPGPPLFHRQARLGAIEGLDLALLVHAQHYGFVRWVEVEPDDVYELFLEVLVVRQLEGINEMGPDPPGRPDALHRRRADTLRPGHRARAPVRLRLGPGEQRVAHDCLHLGLRDGGLATPARTHLAHAAHPFLQKAAPPLEDAGARRAHALSDLRIRYAVGCEQQRLSVLDHSVRALSLIHISEPTRLRRISYAVFCLK